MMKRKKKKWKRQICSEMAGGGDRGRGRQNGGRGRMCGGKMSGDLCAGS